MAVLPFSPAVSVTSTALEVSPAEAVKEAAFWPAATGTYAGTVTRELLLDRDTMMAPFAGEGPLSINVQAAVAGPVTLEGVQFRLMTCNCCWGSDTRRPTVAVLPFSDAVSMTLASQPVAFTEAVNVAEFRPDTTCAMGGTFTMELLLKSATLVPPTGAFPLIVTVQLEPTGPVTVVGVQLKELTVNKAAGAVSVMLPPEPLALMASPDGSETETPERESGIVPVAVGAIWTVRLAIVPGEMTLSFRPYTTQMSDPAPLEHSIDLPAAFAAAPTLALADVMLPGNPTVNSNAAACAPLLAENETDRFAASPGVPDGEFSPTDTVCAARFDTKENSTNVMKRHGLT